MTSNDFAPATKADVAMLITLLGHIEKDLAARPTRDEFESLINTRLDAKAEEIMRHFDVCVENIRHDLEGANRDEIEVLKDTKVDHEQRLVTLEQGSGLRP